MASAEVDQHVVVISADASLVKPKKQFPVELKLALILDVAAGVTAAAQFWTLKIRNSADWLPCCGTAR